MNKLPTRLVAALFAIIPVAACNTQLGVSLSGSSSMRIEVEVYKGPLSKDPWTQYGELIGVVGAMRHSFINTLDFTEQYSLRRGCTDTRHEQERDAKNWLRFVDSEKTNCLMLWELIDDLRYIAVENRTLHALLKPFDPRTIQNQIAGGNKIAIDGIRLQLAQAAFVANWLKSKALFWQGAHVSVGPEDDFLRNAMVNFASLAAEYSNQIGSRADTLLLQMIDTDRRELPLSVYLRDMKPTDFMNLYVWNQAAVTGVAVPPHAGVQKGWYVPRSEDREWTADRVRTLERLYADHYWSKVNTVYASGQGEVSMAFIKDEIGNWNLKSFDNDPTELLQAYSNVAKATLKAAVDLAKSETGVTGAMKMLDLANRVSTGRGTLAAAPTAGGFDVNELHKRAIRDLRNHRDQVTKEMELKNQAVAAAQTRAEAVERSGTEDAKKQAKADLDAAKAARDKTAADAMTRATAILSTHAAIVDILQEGATKGAASSAPRVDAGGAVGAVGALAPGSAASLIRK